MKWQERIGRLFPLLAIAVLMLAVTLIPNLSPVWQSFLGAVGSTFLLAFLLGLTVDAWLKASIVEDAFKAAIGYILPDELRSELEWIYGRRIICIQHDQECELTPIDDDALVIRTSIRRVIRNVSHSKEQVSLSLAIDEWFHPARHSRILEFGYVVGDTPRPNGGGHFEVKRGSYDLHIEPALLELGPRQELTAWYKTEEVKRTNDVSSWVFLFPTRQPVVTIRQYTGLCVTVGFGHRDAPGTVKLGADSYRLPATLLPFQSLHIRWWKESDAKRWVEGASH